VYGAAVLTLPAMMQYGLRRNLPSVLAQRRIQDGKLNWRDPESVYIIWMTAYGDEDLAEDAFTQSQWAVIDEYCPIEQRR
jgi:hypothetical protein